LNFIRSKQQQQQQQVQQQQQQQMVRPQGGNMPMMMGQMQQQRGQAPMTMMQGQKIIALLSNSIKNIFNSLLHSVLKLLL